jgi:MFS family permease
VFPVVSIMMLFMALFSMIFLMPFFLMQPCGFSVKESGLVMVTPFIFLSVFSPLAGALSDKIGSTMLCTVGMSLLSMGLFLLSLLSPLHSPFPAVWRLAIVGFGISIFTAPNNSLIMNSVPKSSMGVASGTLATARNLGMVMGIAIAGSVFNTIFHQLSGGIHLKAYQPSMESAYMTAFHYAMLTGAVVAAIGVPVAFSRGDRKIRTED